MALAWTGMRLDQPAVSAAARKAAGSSARVISGSGLTISSDVELADSLKGISFRIRWTSVEVALHYHLKAYQV